MLAIHNGNYGNTIPPNSSSQFFAAGSQIGQILGRRPTRNNGINAAAKIAEGGPGKQAASRNRTEWMGF